MTLRLFSFIGALGAALAAHGQPADPALSGQLPQQKARVVIAQNPDAVQSFTPQPRKIQSLVDRGITHLTGKTTPAEAWLSLVSTQDVVGIKVYSAPGPTSGTRRSVVAAVVEGLLAAGLSPRQIIVWDRRLVDLRLANYFELADRYGVRIASSADAGYDEEHFYDDALLGNLVFGDLEFGKKGEGVGRKSYTSKLVTKEITKIISIAPMLNHNQAGVCGHLLSVAMGSMDNLLRYDKNPERLPVAIPEIYALPVLGDRVALNITDALLCQYQGEERTLLHYSATLNQLRFSTDPVALDVLSIQELEKQRQRADIPSAKPRMEIYQNASLLEHGVSDPNRINIEMAQ